MCLWNTYTGIDLTDFGDTIQVIQSDDDIARKCKKMYKIVRSYQDSFTQVDKVNI